jgi:hypothetical protein
MAGRVTRRAARALLANLGAIATGPCAPDVQGTSTFAVIAASHTDRGGKD